jgi:hypothetical protein
MSWILRNIVDNGEGASEIAVNMRERLKKQFLHVVPGDYDRLWRIS